MLEYHDAAGQRFKFLHNSNGPCRQVFRGNEIALLDREKVGPECERRQTGNDLGGNRQSNRSDSKWCGNDGVAGGELARNAMNAADPKEYCRNGVEKLYPGFGSERAADNFTNWPSEDWSLGGYSCPTLGQVTTAARKLYKADGRLVWA